jgi:hypothetical protein
MEINLPDILSAANEALQKALDGLRVTKKSIPSRVEPSMINAGIPDERILFHAESSKFVENKHKDFVKLSVRFALSDSEVKTPGRLEKLAMAMAPALAHKEDFYIFQMSDKLHPGRNKNDPGHPCPNVKIDKWQVDNSYTHHGLLAEAFSPEASDCDWTKVSEPIHVPLLSNDCGSLWGKGTASAVLQGIAKLMCKTGKGKEGFALFLPMEVWVDAAIPGDDDAHTAMSLIVQSQMGVDIEVVPCHVLPKDEGLLVNLAGNPIEILYGQQAKITQGDLDDDEYWHFRIVEQVQYVLRDPRALLLLKFEQPTSENSRIHEHEAKD